MGTLASMAPRLLELLMQTQQTQNWTFLLRLWIPALVLCVAMGSLLSGGLAAGDQSRWLPAVFGLLMAGVVFASVRWLQKRRFARALRSADPGPFLLSFAESLRKLPHGSLLAVAQSAAILPLYGRFAEAEEALDGVCDRNAPPVIQAQLRVARAILAYARGEVTEGLDHAVAANLLASGVSRFPGGRSSELAFRNCRNLGLALSGRGTEATERELRTGFERLPLLSQIKAAWGLAVLAKREGDTPRFQGLREFIATRAPHLSPVLASLDAA
jgi:hypothetical protein